MVSHFYYNRHSSYYKTDLLSSHILKRHLYFLSCELLVHIIYSLFYWVVVLIDL